MFVTKNSHANFWSNFWFLDFKLKTASFDLKVLISNKPNPFNLLKTCIWTKSIVAQKSKIVPVLYYLA